MKKFTIIALLALIAILPTEAIAQGSITVWEEPLSTYTTLYITEYDGDRCFVAEQNGDVELVCFRGTPKPATPTPEPSQTPTSTWTATSTNSPTATRTFSPTPTRTWTPSPTWTRTPTKTSTPTATRTLTSIPTWTFTPTSTYTPTATITWTPSPTWTATSTPQTDAHYVSLTGNDSNPGTLDNPFRTIQKGASTGGTIIVLEGTYNERVSVTKPATFLAQGQVTMKGFTVTANDVHIKGFYITDTINDSQNGVGIWIYGSDCIIEDNHIYYAIRGGILINYPSTGCVISGNRLEKNSQYGIDIRGTNHLIENNEIWGTIQYHPGWINPPSWVDADGIHFHGSGHIIRSNYIHDIKMSDQENKNPHIDCAQTFDGGTVYKPAASNILFERNFCDNAQPIASSAMMIAQASNLTITNNIFDTYVGINVQLSSNVYVYHNVITSDLSFQTANYPAGISVTSTSLTAKNNIFYNLPGHVIYIHSGSVVGEKNLMWNSGQTIWSSSYNHSNDLWNVDPLFLIDYYPAPDSPLIDNGAVVPVTIDYAGAPRPQGTGYDIGIFEQ